MMQTSTNQMHLNNAFCFPLIFQYSSFKFSYVRCLFAVKDGLVELSKEALVTQIFLLKFEFILTDAQRIFF